MNREELLKLHFNLTEEAQNLMEKKNRDYSGATGDVFANFNAGEFLGVSPITGVLLRMTDKLSRISSFDTRGELAVKGESVRDSIIDIINYAVLMEGMLQDAKQMLLKEGIIDVNNLHTKPRLTPEEIDDLDDDDIYGFSPNDKE